MSQMYIAYFYKCVPGKENSNDERDYSEFRSQAFPTREEAAEQLFTAYPDTNHVSTCRAMADEELGWWPTGMDIRYHHRLS